MIPRAPRSSLHGDLGKGLQTCLIGSPGIGIRSRTLRIVVEVDAPIGRQPKRCALDLVASVALLAGLAGYGERGVIGMCCSLTSWLQKNDRHIGGLFFLPHEGFPNLSERVGGSRK